MPSQHVAPMHMNLCLRSFLYRPFKYTLLSTVNCFGPATVSAPTLSLLYNIGLAPVHMDLCHLRTIRSAYCCQRLSILEQRLHQHLPITYCVTLVLAHVVRSFAPVHMNWCSWPSPHYLLNVPLSPTKSWTLGMVTISPHVYYYIWVYIWVAFGKACW